MVFILEGIFKGFVQWVYSLCLEMVQYIANSLLEVFQMDLSYFRQVAPVTDDILSIVIAVGWALLLGNLVWALKVRTPNCCLPGLSCLPFCFW